MALKKKIKKKTEYGIDIELNYHRIALLNIDVNNQITILRHSYLKEEDREYEKAYARGEIKGEPTFPYVEAEYMHYDYEDGMDIKKAYELLKAQPGFEKAEDV